MVNAWIKHLTAFRKSNPGMSLGDAMVGAKKTYKSMSKSAEKDEKSFQEKTFSKKRRKTAKKSKKAKRPKKGKRSRPQRKRRK